MIEPIDEARDAILAELHALHDWSMPHDTRYPEWDLDGCPPNCPFREAIEGGIRAIVTEWAEGVEPTNTGAP
jgi:hypothetical protein